MSYFSFKQFTIHQDRCSLRVSTDSCILGAWFAHKISAAENILDIGSGTGLLMLMLAQKSTATVKGIEIEPSCHQQLIENIAGSPWAQRCEAILGDVRTYPFTDSFDVIISNPPFYEQQLESDDRKKNMAKHSSQLVLSELFESVNRLLSVSGSFGVLLPYTRKKFAIELAGSFSLFTTEEVNIRQSPTHEYFRTLLLFERKKIINTTITDLTIKESTGNYSSKLTELLKDYYLFM